MPETGYLEQIAVAQGTVVIQEGDVGDCAYLIERGEIEISVERAGRRVVIARRGAGEIFGEMAIISDEPRSATITTTRDSALLVITRHQVNRRLECADPILRMCLSVILERFHSTLRRLQAIEAEPAPVPSDLANAHAKTAGPSYDQVIREIKLEKELEAAIEREDFELHFQPIADLRTGAVAGFEALVRWHHSERGLVTPDHFIPTAEASGLIVPLSRWCFRAACAALVRLDRAVAGSGRPPLFMSINISSRDLADPSFVAHVDATIADTGVDPRRIKLEITESLLIDHPNLSLDAIDRCKTKGLSICIDDFGTGYSSLSYLHRLPVDALKIDRSFIVSMHQNKQSMDIVRTIVELARQLGIPVVAEGIETNQDAFALRDLGYDYGQGFYFARPMPEAETLLLIRDWPETWPNTARVQPLR